MEAIEQHEEGEIALVTRDALAELDPFEQKLKAFKAQFEGVVYDLDDEEQNKAARSDKHAIGKAIAELDRRHRAVKDPLLEATRMLDGRRKEIKDGLLAVQGRIKSQIEEHENKERQRIQRIADRIEGIRMSAIVEPGESAHIRAEIARIESIEMDESWEEFKADALLAKTEALESLRKQLADREEYEAQQAELEALRKEKEKREREEREARIRAEAEEKAKRDAADAIARAEREKREAEERAERAAEAERQRIADEQAREKAEEERRSKQRRHRIKVQREASESLERAVEFCWDEGEADKVIEAIAAGLVANVTITY